MQNRYDWSKPAVSDAEVDEEGVSYRIDGRYKDLLYLLALWDERALDHVQPLYPSSVLHKLTTIIHSNFFHTNWPDLILSYQLTQPDFITPIDPTWFHHTNWPDLISSYQLTRPDFITPIDPI